MNKIFLLLTNFNATDKLKTSHRSCLQTMIAFTYSCQKRSKIISNGCNSASILVSPVRLADSLTPMKLHLKKILHNSNWKQILLFKPSIQIHRTVSIIDPFLGIQILTGPRFEPRSIESVILSDFSAFHTKP